MYPTSPEGKKARALTHAGLQQEVSAENNWLHLHKDPGELMFMLYATKLYVIKLMLSKSQGSVRSLSRSPQLSGP